MPFIDTPIKDLIVFEPKIFSDARGYFFESYNEKLFCDHGINASFIQDNQSYSTKGTLRGLHLQRGDYAQAKLVRVISGEVLDVAIDLRKNSDSFGKHFSILLSGENQKQLFIPRGFGHGFVVLSDTAIFSYKVDNYYNKESEDGIIYNDPSLNIDWQIDHELISLSDKDKQLGSFNDLCSRI